MKTRMKSKLLAILMSLAMAFTMMPVMTGTAYAKGDSPSVVKSGDLYTFTKFAPITTVRLDAEKFTKTNAALVSENGFYSWGTGESPQKTDSIWTPELTVAKAETEGNEISLPSFSITVKEAAVMRDGTAKDLKVTFDDVTVFTKSGMDGYTDRFQIVRLSDNNSKVGIDISPASMEAEQFGLQAKASWQVVGAAADDTLLLFADEINSRRSESQFQKIKGAADNDNYSESMQLLSGINSESDLYLTENPVIRTAPEDTTNANGYDVRFFGAGDIQFKLAAAVSASGASTNVWSSAGYNPAYPLNMFFISPNNTARELTSSSGNGGKIELWTDGQTHDIDSEATSVRKLAGGTITTPYTYAVPYGKEVTYRMTPEEGYILDKLYVNGSETDPSKTTYKPDSTEIAYYEYHFDSDTVNENQEISVTWKKYAAAADPIPVRKVIAGSAPDQDQAFTILLERVPEPDAPIDGPAGSNADRISIKVSKGQMEANSEIPSLAFKKPGMYVYHVRELNEGAEGYTYDHKVYTVKIVVLPNPDDPDMLICFRQRILSGETEVDICEFANRYAKNDPAPAAGVGGTPLAKATAKGKKSLSLSWSKVDGAEGYDIFFARCDHKKSKNTCKNVKTITGNETFKWTKSGLKKGTPYKFYVRAYVYSNGQKTYVSKSPEMHAYTGGYTKKYTNARSIKLKNVKKGELSLEKGGTFRIKAKVNKVKKNKKLMPKGHAPKLRYMTSDSSIAAVSNNGKITAIGEGTCTVYVLAHNGVSKSIKVVVK